MINYKHSANNDACRLAKKTSNIDASGSIQYNSQQARLNVIKMGKNHSTRMEVYCEDLRNIQI